MLIFRGFILFLFLLVLGVSDLMAWVWFEPYGGYSVHGRGESSYSDSGNYTHSYFGVTYGGRIGPSFKGIIGGLDYSVSGIDFDSHSSGREYGDRVTKEQWGIWGGYRFPKWAKVWATYFFKGKMEGDDASTPQTHAQYITILEQFQNGKGFALGAGFMPAPHFSLNLEYRSISYDSNQVNGVPVSTYSKKLSISELLLTFSAPLDLP